MYGVGLWRTFVPPAVAADPAVGKEIGVELLGTLQTPPEAIWQAPISDVVLSAPSTRCSIVLLEYVDTIEY